MMDQRLQEWKQRGVVVLVDGQELVVRAPKGTLTPDILSQIKAAKHELLELLTPKRPNYWHDRYEERAAIMEHDGGFVRQEAEQWAMRDVLYEYVQRYYPAVLGACHGAITERVH